MTKEQEATLIDHLQNLTHALMPLHGIAHEEKVKLLDSLSEVKRAFGFEEPVGDPT